MMYSNVLLSIAILFVITFSGKGNGKLRVKYNYTLKFNYHITLYYVTFGSWLFAILPGI